MRNAPDAKTTKTAATPTHLMRLRMVWRGIASFTNAEATNTAATDHSKCRSGGTIAIVRRETSRNPATVANCTIISTRGRAIEELLVQDVILASAHGFAYSGKAPEKMGDGTR